MLGGPDVDALKDRRDLAGLAQALRKGRTRAAAVRAICELDDADAVLHVVHVDSTLGSRDDKARACEAIYAHFGPRVVGPLVAAMRGDGGSRSGLAAPRLGQAGEEIALQPLLEALRDSDPAIRESAAFGLRELRSPRATDDLVAALRDPELMVREAAAEALVAGRDVRAAEGVAGLLADDHAPLRVLAASSLRSFDEGEWAVYWLKRAADDPDEDVRSVARSELRALGQAPPGEAAPAADTWRRGPAPADPKRQCFCGCGRQLESKDQKNVSRAAVYFVDALGFVRQQAIPYFEAVKRQEAHWRANDIGQAGRAAEIDGPLDQLLTLADRGERSCAHYADAVHDGRSMKQLDQDLVKPFLQEAGEWRVELTKKLAAAHLRLDDFEKLGPDRVVAIVDGRLWIGDDEVKRLRKG